MARPNPVPLTDRPLYALLGLPAGTGISQLRFAYERAMAQATRSGDSARALALSRAFDRLSYDKRRQVYTTIVERGGTRPVARPAPVAASRRRRTPAARRRRALTCLLVASLAVAALIVMVLDVDHLVPRDGPSTPGPAPAQVLNSVPSSGATHVDRQARVIPADTPVNRQGYVMVVCRDAAGDSGTVQFVRPGAVVTCPNGTMPSIVADR